MNRYLVLIEEGPTSFGASSPDLPGCVAVAESRVEVQRLIHEAIELHLAALRVDGEPVPLSTITASYVEV